MNQNQVAHGLSSLQWKLISTIMVLILGIQLLLYLPLSYLSRQSTLFLEQSDLYTHGERVKLAITDLIEQYEQSIIAIAQHPNTYQFIRQQTPSYVFQYLSRTNLIEKGLNSLVLMDLNFTPIVTATDQPRTTIPLDIMNYLRQHPESVEPAKAFVLLLQGQPWLIIPAVIVPANASTLPRGYLFGAVAINRSLLPALNHRTQVDVRLVAQTDLSSTEQAAITQQPNNQSIRIAPFNATTNEILVPIESEYGTPFWAIINIPRTLYQELQSTFWRFLITIGVSGIVGLGGIIVVARWLIFGRLKTIQLQLQQLDLDQPQSNPLTIPSTDELGQLSVVINEVMNALVQARHAQDLSYQELQQQQIVLIDSQQQQLTAQANVLRLQEHLLTEQACPLIPLSKQILTVPLIGTFNLRRMKRLQTTIWQGLDQQQTRHLILDFTAVVALDTDTLLLFEQMIQSLMLLNIATYVTGMTPALAELLVQHSVFSTIRCFQTLAEGIAWVIQQQQHSR